MNSVFGLDSFALAVLPIVVPLKSAGELTIFKPSAKSIMQPKCTVQGSTWSCNRDTELLWSADLPEVESDALVKDGTMSSMCGLHAGSGMPSRAPASYFKNDIGP